MIVEPVSSASILALHDALVAKAIAVVSDYPFGFSDYEWHPEQKTARLAISGNTATLSWPAAQYDSFVMDEREFPAELLTLDDAGLADWRASKRSEERAAKAAATAKAEAEAEAVERAEFERLKAKFS